MMDDVEKIISAAVISLFLVGCASTSTPERQAEKGEELTPLLLDRGAAISPSRFLTAGPFSISVRRNLSIQLSADESIVTDVFLPKHDNLPPLVIFVHGNASFKETHSKQAERLATWGLAAVTVQLRNEDHWIENGKILNRLVRLLYTWPEKIPGRFDGKNIILVGHSFGGTAVSIAAGMTAPLRGLILLDPAVYSSEVTNYLRRIRVPVLILGADRRVFRSKRRDHFFRTLERDVAEISLVGATHDDAQYPSRMELQAFGIDFITSQEHQERFAASILAASLSLTKTGKWDGALRGFQTANKIKPQYAALRSK